MILPGDPILYLFLIVGVFIYYAFKSLGEVEPDAPVSVKPKTKAEERTEVEEYHDRFIQQLKDSGKDVTKCDGYITWLYNHSEEHEKEMAKRCPT